MPTVLINRVRLSGERIREWIVPDSLVVWASAFGNLIGYAIAVQRAIPRAGTISWITQLVVHTDHRRQDVGKTLLFTVWRFTDHFAWGLLSANPFAIRALEKATRRRCQPARIARDANRLMNLAPGIVPYVKCSTEVEVTETTSCADTNFYLDHSELPAMLASAANDGKPWTLGSLREGWEWFAFTFRDQEQLRLSHHELQQMMSASDELTKYAYSRMSIDEGAHLWAKHHRAEVDYIVNQCQLKSGMTLLDFGCGQGRHTLEAARRGIISTGVDYLSSSIEKAREEATGEGLVSANFLAADCRTVELETKFDVGICLYDVIGSYADEDDNLAVLNNLSRHIKPNGLVVLSVMNLELTQRIAKYWFSIVAEPDRLLTLPPSGTMEKTGDIFDPKYYMIDRETNLVYRKEQFTRGQDLPEELLIRDRRYTEDQIRQACGAAGLEVLSCRFVRAGRWGEPLQRESDKAKEILVLCRKAAQDNFQQNLFQLGVP